MGLKIASTPQWMLGCLTRRQQNLFFSEIFPRVLGWVRVIVW